MSPVTYIPGFSDFFAAMANGAVKDPAAPDAPITTARVLAMFDQARNAFNGRMLRFEVKWSEVEKIEPGQPGHTLDFSDYNALAALAFFYGFQLLPHVVDAPLWARGEDPNPPNPPPDYVPIYNGFPREEKLPQFGTFVAETLAHFASFPTTGHCRAVEVCNEPNRDVWRIEPQHYKLMLYSALEAVAARSYPFQPTYKPTVVSGGLACNNKDTNHNGTPDWQEYLAEILNQCPPVLPSGELFHPAVGIHPYDLSSHAALTAISDFVSSVIGKWNAAANIATAGNDIWITEFGCTAESAYGFSEQTKSDALQVLLRPTGGFFTLQSRCKAVLLYRYLPQAAAGDDQDGNLYWNSVPMLDNNLSGKQPVMDMLKTSWTNAPS